MQEPLHQLGQLRQWLLAIFAGTENGSKIGKLGKLASATNPVPAATDPASVKLPQFSPPSAQYHRAIPH